MKYYTLIWLLCISAYIYASEEITTIFTIRKELTQKFLNHTQRHTCNYKRTSDHLIALVENDTKNIFRNDQTVMTFPMSLYYDVDNEEPPTTLINTIFYKLLEDDRICVQMLYTLYTQNEQLQETISLETDNLIEFLHGYSEGIYE